MITILDYKAGNLTSVRRALDHLGIPNQIIADPDVVCRAEKIIFPGVGAAGSAMRVLQERGLDEALKESIRAGTPTLGICIGCQIILTSSEEDQTNCLDLVSGTCVRFRLDDPSLKVPHVGWNTVVVTQSHPVLSHVRPGDEFYFVHSYYPQPDDDDTVFATSDYGGTFPVAIGVDTLFAVQFHAEKSGPVGLELLKNFSNWSP